jgi:hypothetical protein
MVLFADEMSIIVTDKYKIDLELISIKLLKTLVHGLVLICLF